MYYSHVWVQHCCKTKSLHYSLKLDPFSGISDLLCTAVGMIVQIIQLQVKKHALINDLMMWNFFTSQLRYVSRDCISQYIIYHDDT